MYNVIKKAENNAENISTDFQSAIWNDASRFGIGIRDESEPNHWLETDNISFADKKTILILPGNGTNGAKTANGMCKIVQNMLSPECLKNVQICSLYYANENISPEPTVIRAQKLLDNYIIPLVSIKDKNGDLHRVPASKAARNMRNLVIVTHCYGGFILNEIEKHLNFMMQDLGYLADERKFILKQLIVAQHNNIDTDLGKKDTDFTNFIRLSSSDEKIISRDTALGTFYNYIKTNEPEKGDALYLKLTDNIRVLLVEKITKLGGSDHNGGYWKGAIYKSSAGKKEEQLFKAIFQETVNSDYLIENSEQILENIVKKHPDLQELIAESFAKGKKYAQNARDFSRLLKAEYKETERQLTNGDFSASDVSKEVLLLYDENEKFLLDKLLAAGKIKTAEKIATVMFEKLPKLHFSKFRYEEYQPYPKTKNEERALDKAPVWAQRAIKLDSVAVFGAIAPNLPITKWKKLNFEHASEQIMDLAVKELLQKEIPDGLDRQEYYSQAFTSIYARVEKLPESAKRLDMLNSLNQRVLAPIGGMQRPLSYYILEKMQMFADEKSVAGLQKVLQNCIGLENVIKKQNSFYKDR